MARWVLVGFVVAFLVCLAQAYPQTEAPAGQSSTDQLKNTLNGIVESVQKGIQGIMDDPNLTKIVKDGQQALEKAAQAISNEAAKIMPKTD